MYRFVRQQNKNVRGLSESARLKRKNRNLVTIKFNMINWALETLGTLSIVVLPTSTYFFLLYMLLCSCGTPVVYFLGIEENMKTAREIGMKKLNVISRKKKNLPQCRVSQINPKGSELNKSRVVILH